MLSSYSVGVQYPLRAGAASWAAANPRGSSPGQPDLEGLSENVGRSFHGLAMLVLAFLGSSPFPGCWRCLVLLCGGVAPLKGKQVRAGIDPVVVGF